MNNSKVINISNVKDCFEKQLNDKDINALFLGLVRLIKKQAVVEANRELQKECFEANENFRQTIIDLNKVESLLKEERKKNIKLQNELEIEKKRYQIICNLE